MTVKQLATFLDAIQTLDSPEVPVLCEFEVGDPPGEILEVTLSWKDGRVSGVILS